MYAVIMAGGSGTRFWPRSRRRKPKQLLNIVGGNTMIQDAVLRIAPLVPPADVLVSTGAPLAEEIRRQLPAVPEANFIIEPVGRNTAPCIALAALHLARRNQDAVMAALTADHLIADAPKFLATLELAGNLCVRHEAIVVFGVKPERPETGFGYIEAGEKIETTDAIAAHRVVRFVEKPDLPTAETFLATGRFRFNSGMFVCRANLLLDEYEKHAPEIHAGLMEIAAVIGTPEEKAVVEKVFPRFPAISADYAILEKTSRIIMVDADFGWNDVGSWASLYELSPRDGEGNAAAAGRAFFLDSRGCLVHSPGKTAAVLGAKDLIIVETGDALLVCDRDRAQDIRRIVALLKEKNLEELL